MKKRRSLGHVSFFHALEQAVVDFIDLENVTGSAEIVTAAFEARLDTLEDSNDELSLAVTDLSSSVSSSLVDINSLNSTVTTVVGDLSALSSSFVSLSQSFALLSASIGSGGGISVSGTAELSFNGDTLMTDADVYISGSGNNLYLHGTNDAGLPAKFEFSIVSGSTIIKEVPHTDFGEEVDDPWFKFDGETLLTHADIYVTGSNNYLYLNGTDENGDYGIFYFDIVSGSVYILQSGSS